MKSKKKLLLMGVGVMGALAMGVGATSTFAWYQATLTGRAAATASSSALSVTKVETLTTATTINIQIEVTRVTGTGYFSNKALQLTTWNASDSKYEYMAYDANNVLKESQLVTDACVPSWGYVVTATGNQSSGSPLTQAQYEALRNSKITLSIKRTGTGDNTSAAIKAWIATAQGTPTPDPIADGASYVASAENVVDVFTYPSDYAAASIVIGYVGIYVDGTTGDSTALNGSGTPQAESAYQNLKLVVAAS